MNYGVTFPMFAKIEVNGARAHPLYKYLKDARPGLLGTEAIKWNFTKFLVDRDGEPVARFAPKTKPEDLEAPIRKLLKLHDHAADLSRPSSIARVRVKVAMAALDAGHGDF